MSNRGLKDDWILLATSATKCIHITQFGKKKFGAFFYDFPELVEIFEISLEVIFRKVIFCHFYNYLLQEYRS